MDIVIPSNNEKEFILLAEKLGYKTLCFLNNFDKYLGKKKFESKNVKISCGLIADSKNIDRIKNILEKLCFSSELKDKVLIAIKSSENNREIIEGSKANIIFSLEENNKRDFMHQRASGLNHILCRLAEQNNVIIGFSLSSILDSKNKHIILGRIMQNIKLCRKYKTKTVIASFASNPYEIKSPHDIISLFLALGMHPKEAKDSLNK